MRKLTLFLALVLTTMLVAQPTVSIQDQKMLVSNGENSYVLAPNGDDASYFWASVSPDGKHIVSVTETTSSVPASEFNLTENDSQETVLKAVKNL